MKALFLGLTAFLACPAIVVLLLLSWRCSWLARMPSLPFMLAAIALCAWAVYAVRRLQALATKSGGFAADKIGMILVAIGFLWIVFLGLTTQSTLRMSRVVGVVDKVENGRAYVSFPIRERTQGGYDFPQFDNFSILRTGDSVSLIREWKTTEVASRTWVFTFLGVATAALLIMGGLRGRRIPMHDSGSTTMA